MKAIALHITDDGVVLRELPDFRPRSFYDFFCTVKREVGPLNTFHASKVANMDVAFVDGINMRGFVPADLQKLDTALQAEIHAYRQYKKSISYAIKAHGEQKYSTLKLPYVYHLMQTDKVVDAFYHEMPAGKVMGIKAAALLHDTLEDTPATAEDITANFGTEVMQTVRRVTKFDEKNTPDYEAAYYQQVAESPLSVFVKIADKCANTKQTVKYFSPWHAKRIIDGHELFKSCVYDKVDAPMLKSYLDNLILKLGTMNER